MMDSPVTRLIAWTHSLLMQGAQEHSGCRQPWCEPV